MYVAYISLYLDKTIREQETTEVMYSSEVSRSQGFPTNARHYHPLAPGNATSVSYRDFIFVVEHNAAAYLERGNNIIANLTQHTALSKHLAD